MLEKAALPQAWPGPLWAPRPGLDLSWCRCGQKTRGSGPARRAARPGSVGRAPGQPAGGEHWPPRRGCCKACWERGGRELS